MGEWRMCQRTMERLLNHSEGHQLRNDVSLLAEALSCLQGSFSKPPGVKEPGSLETPALLDDNLNKVAVFTPLLPALTAIALLCALVRTGVTYCRDLIVRILSSSVVSCRTGAALTDRTLPWGRKHRNCSSHHHHDRHKGHRDQ